MLNQISNLFKYLSENKIRCAIAAIGFLITVVTFIFLLIDRFKPSETDVMIKRELEILCLNYKKELQNKKAFLEKGDWFIAMQQGSDQWKFLSENKWNLKSLNYKIRPQFEKVEKLVGQCASITMATGGDSGEYIKVVTACDSKVSKELDAFIEILK